MPDEISDTPVSGGLDQSEIDRLLAQASGEAVEARPPVLRADGRREDAAADLRVEAYDFRNPVFLSEVELRRLRLLHDEFIRHLGSRIALFLRMECTFRMTRLTTLTHVKFTESLPAPSHICLFKADPLPGIGVLTINPRLALTIVDRMLGGRGHSVTADRHLTEIEIALLEDMLTLLLEEWCIQWKAGPELHPQIVGHENNGCFLQTSARDAVMLVLALDVNFGDCTGALNLAVPYYMIETVVRDLQARRHQDNAPAARPDATGWKPVYEHIALPVRAEWPVFEASLREIASLRVGDVLELPAGILDDTRVLLAGAEKFTGTVGVEGDRVAVKINRKLPTRISQ
ncbi:flagellar motor switch protein FliM [Opitutaceae bacterium TAV4]|nr:flagellar motor switch protein FliM [Opitutaceae bacterium TAV4]RRK02612.1 flagellar motor switch protein FliM [Opitutaceae bacterium TAV3]